MALNSNPSNVPVEVWRLRHGCSPGRFLGYGSLVSEQIVLLHPAPDAGSRRPTTGRARARIGSGSQVEVLDGDIVAGTLRSQRRLRLIALDGSSAAATTDLPWPRRGDAESAREFAAAVMALTQQDPPGVPGTAPTAADHPHANPHQHQLRPPWCWLFPKCAGCH